jgi:diguanylate cyclase (GGDEF)-like protein
MVKREMRAMTLPSASSQQGAAAWLRRRWLVFAALSHLALYALCLNLLSDALLNALYYVAPVTAVGAGIVATRGASGRDRIGVLALAIAVTAWIVGDMFYTVTGNDPPPVLPDVFYYTGYLALALAVPLLGLPRDSHPSWRSLFDGGAIVIILGSLFLRFFVGPAAAAADSSLLETTLIAGYPVLDLAVLGMLILTLYQRAPGTSFARFNALVAAAFVLALADSAYLWAYLHVDTSDTSALDLAWLASYWLIVASLTARPEAPSAEAQPNATVSSIRVALPYLCILPFAVMAFIDATRQGAPILLVGLVVAFGVMLVRQWLTLRENVSLQNELERRRQVTVAMLEDKDRLNASLQSQAAEATRLQLQARHLANHDSLTGLLNHRGWWNEAIRSGARSLALFDIDHFKIVNDCYGHRAGDDVIAEIAHRLQRLLPEAILIGRLGGEEFGALFATSARFSQMQCREAIAALGREPVVLGGGGSGLIVTISGGVADIATGGDPATTIEGAYERADALLYRAKSRGRNRVESAAEAA